MRAYDIWTHSSFLTQHDRNFIPGGYSQKPPSWITALLWQTGLCNSMKPWAMLFRATQDGPVIERSSDKTWSTGRGSDNPLQYYSRKNPGNSLKGQKEMLAPWRESFGRQRNLVCCGLCGHRHDLMTEQQQSKILYVLDQPCFIMRTCPSLIMLLALKATFSY